MTTTWIAFLPKSRQWRRGKRVTRVSTSCWALNLYFGVLFVEGR